MKAEGGARDIIEAEPSQHDSLLAVLAGPVLGKSLQISLVSLILSFHSPSGSGLKFVLSICEI